MFKKLICKLFGHDFKYDYWQIYYNGHRMCQRCGKWEY